MTAMTPAVPNFKIVSLTEAAAARAQELLASRQKPTSALKIGVKNGGCAGMSYTMELVEEAAPFEEVVEDKGVKVIIDPKALLFVFGMQIDFETNKLSSGFVFNNPNQTGSCGCGESVTLTPVDEKSFQQTDS
jgi:iron-sulfur cluster assembly protein